MDLSHADWHKSTRSGGSGNCVEVAINLPAIVAVRDTKDRGQGPVLTFGTEEWQAFVGCIRAGGFDFSG
ncbi:MAG TPA: DUF397 domain-containing protein [Actinoplanes sp.]|jgi:hypothetical protein